MLTALEIAEHFVAISHRDRQPISHLKLQKLLYFAQGYHLAVTRGNPLFSDEIQAWKFGPVIPSIYNVYKTHGNNPINEAGNMLKSAEEPLLRFLDKVWKIISPFSAIRLSSISHTSGGPWHRIVMENGGDVGMNRKIPLELMTNYFSQLIKKPEHDDHR